MQKKNTMTKKNNSNWEFPCEEDQRQGSFKKSSHQCSICDTNNQLEGSKNNDWEGKCTPSRGRGNFISSNSRGGMAIEEIQEDITLSQEQAKVMEVGETKGALDYNHKTFCFGI
jgi:hypothetical protein